MRDLEELLSLVRDRESKKYFEEGIKAYHAGAYRASIVETWVAVALDLISKIRYLSERQDPQAIDFVKHLDNAIQSANKAKLQKIENELLKKARELELLTPREEAELQRLYLDRNVCAHPAFVAPEEVFKPNAEQVRAHLASAVDNVLSLPAVSGRKLIDQFRQEIASDNWPSYSNYNQYVEMRFLKSARHSVKRSIVELVVKTAIEPPDLDSNSAVSSTAVSARARVAINSIALNDSILLNNAIESVIQKRQKAEGLSDTVLLRITGSLGQFQCTWTVLSDSDISRILTLVSTSDTQTLKQNRALVCWPVYHTEIEEKVGEKRSELISTFDGLQHMLKTVTYGRRNLIPAVISQIRYANTFRDAEDRLRDFAKLARESDISSLRDFGKAVRENNQVYLAMNTETILRNICEQTKEIAGVGIVWQEIADGLHEDYLHSGEGTASNEYSYSDFKDFVAAFFNLYHV